MGKQKGKKGKGNKGASKTDEQASTTEAGVSTSPTIEESSDSQSEVIDEGPQDFYEQRALEDNAEGTKFVKDEPTIKLNQDEDLK